MFPFGVDVFIGEVIVGVTFDINVGVEMVALLLVFLGVIVISDRLRKVCWYSYGVDFIELVVEILVTENTICFIKSFLFITLIILFDQDVIVYSLVLLEDNV